jgi:hypothetical protein
MPPSRRAGVCTLERWTSFFPSRLRAVFFFDLSAKASPYLRKLMIVFRNWLPFNFAMPPAERFGALVMPPEESFNGLPQLIFGPEASSFKLSVLRCSRLNTISIWCNRLAHVGVK